MVPLFSLLQMKMHKTLWVGFFLLTISCQETTPVENEHTLNDNESQWAIPEVMVDLSMLHYEREHSLWRLDSQNFSGYAISIYPDGSLKERISFLNGRKEGQATQWYPDKHLKRQEHYHLGKLHGVKKSWSTEEDHLLISRLNYQQGKAHGEQRFWYATGELYKILNLNMGKEEGLQQAFRLNGVLYANYEARDGRVFGLRKAKLCYGLEDEEVNKPD